MLILSFSFLFGCRSDSAKVQLDEDTSVEEPEWWDSESNDSEASTESDSEDEEKEEDTGDKPEDGEFEEEKDSGFDDVSECGEDFDPNLPCQGDWTTTLCISDGLMWWCEDGVWLNEEDK